MRVPFAFACFVAFGLSPAMSFEPLGHAERGRKACAALDLNLLELIEEHGEADELDAMVLFRLVERMVEARQHCMHGRFDEAILLYGGIALRPVRTKSLR